MLSIVERTVSLLLSSVISNNRPVSISTKTPRAAWAICFSSIPRTRGAIIDPRDDSNSTAYSSNIFRICDSVYPAAPATCAKGWAKASRRNWSYNLAVICRLPMIESKGF